MSVYFANSQVGWTVGYYGSILSTINGGSVFISKISSEIPKQFRLHQNYPNPFNPETKIRFEIPSDVKRKTSNVKLIIYDILGKEIVTLVNEQLQPGLYEVTFNGQNLSSGIYFYQLRLENFTDTKKLVLIK